MDKMMKKIKSVHFGISPLKAKTEYANREAVYQVRQYLTNQITTVEDIKLEISIVKGLFNRILRQDQWDWFIINTYFDYPYINDLAFIANHLNRLRISIRDNKTEEIDRVKKALWLSRCITYLDNYLGYKPGLGTDTDYIFILTCSQTKDVLIIERGIREVQSKIKQANSGRDDGYEFFAYKGYKVKDSVLAEQLIYKELEQYRMTEDSGLFKVYCSQASKIIDTCLKENKLLSYGI